MTTPDRDDDGSPSATARIDELVERWQEGDDRAGDELFPLVERELRAVAARHLQRERADHSLQPTELVNEAYLRLAGLDRMTVEGKAHLRALAGRLMRRILIDHARRKSAARRADPAGRVQIELDRLAEPGQHTEVRVLEAALERLAELDPRQARVVELRFFSGFSVEEVAAQLDLSTATVGREWRAAKVWLKRELRTPAR